MKEEEKKKKKKKKMKNKTECRMQNEEYIRSHTRSSSRSQNHRQPDGLGLLGKSRLVLVWFSCS